MRYKISVSEVAFNIFSYLLLIILSISAVYPFLNSIALAFNQGNDSLRGGIYFWPRLATLENFKAIFSNNDILNGTYVSVFKTVVGTLLHVSVTAACAFSLSKRYLPGNKLLTAYLLIPTLFGGGIVPYYILLRSLHLTNSIWVYILPSLFSFFNILIIRTYFESLPAEIEEAAIIEGCNYFTILIRIIMPLSLPVIATVALFTAVGQWNDWFAGYFFVSRNELQPLSTILVNFLKENDTSSIFDKLGVNSAHSITRTYTSESLKMAVLVVVTMPILVTYPFLQKYFLKGVLIGSVKG
ncbi:MAG: hypothetical protein A2Y21_05475 [Clostridiales bacterium GWC2_40_7]|nr:MAG: hypothetical protein A2Y21_05475 [Clostridiales bacterium GWC2_40_7]